MSCLEVGGATARGVGAGARRSLTPRAKVIGWLMIGWLAAIPVRSQPPDALEMARRLADVGPRAAGEGGHSAAADLLIGWMSAVGLQQVERRAAGADAATANLTGVLPGASGLEVYLTAHFDSVAGTPGAADDAAGCAVVLAAVSRLSAVPRHHTVRVVLFDGEERQLVGSRAWMDELPADRRRQVLGALNVDLIGWNPAAPGAVRIALSGDSSRRRLAPGWLVHAVVRGSRAIDSPVAVASSRLSLAAQLVGRAFLPTFLTDAEAMSAGGIPAVTLSEADLLVDDRFRHTELDRAERLDAVALDRWTDRLSATVRRLDALAGRPRDDDQYLAALGRVFSRRDLYWINLAVWMALVFVGLPGRWRAQDRGERQRRGRAYLPGFTLRLLFLASILMLPVFTTLLVLPAALVSLVPVRYRRGATWMVALATLPWAALVSVLTYLAFAGRLGTLALGLPAAALLLASFGSITWVLGTSGRSTSRGAC